MWSSWSVFHRKTQPDHAPEIIKFQRAEPCPLSPTPEGFFAGLRVFLQSWTVETFQQPPQICCTVTKLQHWSSFLYQFLRPNSKITLELFFIRKMRLVPLNFQQVLTSSLTKDFWDAPCEFNPELLEQWTSWHWQRKKKKMAERQCCCQGLGIFFPEAVFWLDRIKDSKQCASLLSGNRGCSSGETMHMSLQHPACSLREKKKNPKQVPQERFHNVKQTQGGILRRNLYHCSKGKLSPQCFSNKMGV